VLLTDLLAHAQHEGCGEGRSVEHHRARRGPPGAAYRAALNVVRSIPKPIACGMNLGLPG
jgi:hypothetical protein